MNKLLILIILTLATVLFITPSFSSSAPSNKPTTTVISKQYTVITKEISTTRKQALTHLIKQDCGSCHGMTLKGGLGPALLPEDLEGKSTLFIQNTIMHGRPGTAMPPWKTLLTEQETLWISKQLQQGLPHD